MVAQSIAPAIAPVVLLTRPAAQSARFAESLWARAPWAQIVTCPLIAPRFLTPDLPIAPWEAVILSSETGALAAGRMKQGLPDLAYCVGDRTAQAARQAGFTTLSAQGDAEDLLALILSQPVAPLLHLRGREARGGLAQRLSASGIETTEAVVYAQEAQRLTAKAAHLLQGPDPVLVPLFSSRSAEILVEECLRVGSKAPLTVVAMSSAVAVAAAPLSARMMIANQPTGETMLEVVVKHMIAGLGA